MASLNSELVKFGPPYSMFRQAAGWESVYMGRYCLYAPARDICVAFVDAQRLVSDNADEQLDEIARGFGLVRESPNFDHLRFLDSLAVVIEEMYIYFPSASTKGLAVVLRYADCMSDELLHAYVDLAERVGGVYAGELGSEYGFYQRPPIPFHCVFEFERENRMRSALRRVVNRVAVRSDALTPPV